MKIREEILEFETFYHIYNRGVNSQNVFLNTDNYSFFLQKAEKYLLKYFDIYAYSLMPNHFHFIVKTKSLVETNFDKIENVIDDNLIFSKTIGSFLSSYTQSFNKVYQRTGALFESPFKRLKIDSEDYLRNLIVYVHQNPENFKEYKFSSYKSICSQSKTHIKRNEVLEIFNDIENFKFCHLSEVEL